MGYGGMVARPSPSPSAFQLAGTRRGRLGSLCTRARDRLALTVLARRMQGIGGGGGGGGEPEILCWNAIGG